MGATTTNTAADPDPFAIFHTPPPNETPGERVEREAAEAEAKRVSDQIDDQLKVDKAAMKKAKNSVRVLLLGQSESDFRMKYAREAWDAERVSWRAVIQLNVIRSIITIVEALQAEMDGEPIDAPSTPLTAVPRTPATAAPYDPLSRPGDSPAVTTSFGADTPTPTASSSSHAPALRASGSSTSLARHASGKHPLSTLLTGKHQVLKMRLGPLRRVETDLKRRLGAGADEDMGLGVVGAEGEGVLGTGAGLGLGPLSLETDSQLLAKQGVKKEFGVVRLQEALERGLVRRASAQSFSRHGHGKARSAAGSLEEEDEEVVDDATEIIASCLEDMKALWTDEVVKVVLRKRKIRIEDTAGFFLDDLDRIARRDYEPSDDDVVRARLRTLGVQEYKIRLDDGPSSVFAGGIGGDAGKEWLLYDVGGSRTSRHAWLPYFDNVQAIIFPVSCFDERLSEDSRVNRLEDSFLLWRTVCSSKLLATTTMILFLNKCDLLKRKLRSGVMVKKYLPSYGERANDTNTVVKYLREKFKEQLKEHSPGQRSSYFYATSVVDTKATAATIKAVKDSILRDYLKSADFV
ncbi:hypothetical protein CVT25_007227 [Psilocybe cyanescens]|uniref:G-alpha-domain-containing protein n=1 Tax=Psilocybe cyanescens TaxID=93625 RepID=A0A409XVS5_PSICY|nr:hypothetical protein CVT25_007227 [Psilocybe cyanescens]